jgi:hypothetical protein
MRRGQVATDQRSAEIELGLDDARPVVLELEWAGAGLSEPLSLAHEPTDLFLERLNVDHVLPQTDAHKKRYRHETAKIEVG